MVHMVHTVCMVNMIHVVHMVRMVCIVYKVRTVYMVEKGKTPLQWTRVQPSNVPTVRKRQEGSR